MFLHFFDPYSRVSPELRPTQVYPVIKKPRRLPYKVTLPIILLLLCIQCDGKELFAPTNIKYMLSVQCRSVPVHLYCVVFTLAA